MRHQWNAIIWVKFSRIFIFEELSNPGTSIILNKVWLNCTMVGRSGQWKFISRDGWLAGLDIDISNGANKLLGVKRSCRPLKLNPVVHFRCASLVNQGVHCPVWKNSWNRSRVFFFILHNDCVSCCQISLGWRDNKRGTYWHFTPHCFATSSLSFLLCNSPLTWHLLSSRTACKWWGSDEN